MKPGGGVSGGGRNPRDNSGVLGLCQPPSGQDSDRDLEKPREIREAGRMENTIYFGAPHAEKEPSRRTMVQRLNCWTT